VRPLLRVEFERLVDTGAFDEERIELLDGVIVEMSPQSTWHADAIMQLTELLMRAVQGRARVRVQLPFAASEVSLPEPDVALVPPGDYRSAHPQTAHLIVEVALESLRKDRTLKAELYARARVPEYWVVNLVDRCIEVRTLPVDGAYTKLDTFTPGASVRLGALDAEIRVSDVLR
jgi:Uma2 family endonuclease